MHTTTVPFSNRVKYFAFIVAVFAILFSGFINVILKNDTLYTATKPYCKAIALLCLLLVTFCKSSKENETTNVKRLRCFFVAVSITTLQVVFNIFTTEIKGAYGVVFSLLFLYNLLLQMELYDISTWSKVSAKFQSNPK